MTEISISTFVRYNNRIPVERLTNAGFEFCDCDIVSQNVLIAHNYFKSLCISLILQCSKNGNTFIHKSNIAVIIPAV